MVELVIVYWRDIPAQVIVGRGRKAKKKQLPERFEKAIDKCAMKIGATGTDTYLQEWHKSPPIELEGDPEIILENKVNTIETQYDSEMLKSLIANSGWKS